MVFPNSHLNSLSVSVIVTVSGYVILLFIHDCVVDLVTFIYYSNSFSIRGGHFYDE